MATIRPRASKIELPVVEGRAYLGRPSMRFCVLILTSLASIAAARAADSRDADLDRLSKEAHVSRLVDGVGADIRARNYEAALKKANEAAALEPDSAVVLNAQGAALTELKRFDDASRVLDRAAAADPRSFAPQFNRGEILFLQKKYADAAAYFSHLQDTYGPVPILKYKIYLSYALGGQKDLAGEALGVMRYPQDGAAWYFAYAVDRLLSGRTAEAKKLISTSEILQKDDSPTFLETLQDTGLLK